MTSERMSDALRIRVARELATPVPGEMESLAKAIRHRFSDKVSAILFYGACRRTADLGGLLDLYVLLDDYRTDRKHWPAAFANRLLPPNVIHLTVPPASGCAGPAAPATRLAAKVAIISTRQFESRVRPGSLDTTIWTRFCQPSSLLYVRDALSRQRVENAVADGVRTAVFWACHLAAAEADKGARWRALFAHTYRLELRPEKGNRGSQIYEAAPAWFDEVMALALAETPHRRRRHWFARHVLGKPLNAARLMKAAFTFEGGADYISAKLGRHTGIVPVPTAWQRRHPLLGAPGLWLKHRRALRRGADLKARERS